MRIKGGKEVSMNTKRKAMFGLLLKTCHSFCVLLAAMTAGVLFLLWYPDFISWFSSKFTAIPSFLGFIPIVVLVGGLSGIVFLAYLALPIWRETKLSNENP